MKYLILLFLSITFTFAGELKFAEVPSDYFERNSKLLDKDKGLICIGRVEKTYKSQEEIPKSDGIKFFDNKELKGKPIAHYKGYIKPKGWSFIVDGKEVCEDDPYQAICKSDFLRDGDTFYRNCMVIFNVEIENKEENLISVTHNGKKLYSKYPFSLDEDYIISINERRKKINSCLNKALERGLEKRITETQECWINFPIRERSDKCDEKGYDVWVFLGDTDDQKDPEILEKINGIGLDGNQLLYKITDYASKEVANRNYLQELIPRDCIVKKDGKIIIKIEPYKTIFKNCKFDRISIDEKKISIEHCVVE